MNAVKTCITLSLSQQLLKTVGFTAKGQSHYIEQHFHTSFIFPSSTAAAIAAKKL
jgi:hypothetical protein